MKKIIRILLAVALLMTAIPAVAEEAPSTVGYSGTVDYQSVMTVTAPFGGTLEDYHLRVGDTVEAGQTLFQLGTTKVYAPIDGTVRGLHATPGDEAATGNERYGALLYLEPVGRYTLNATTSNAYDSDKTHNRNRYLTEGETVYLQSADDHDRTGVGIITQVDGRSFTVEVQQSNLDLEELVTIYRDSDYTTAQRIASRAKVQRADAVAIAPEGSVLTCMVQEGQTVHRGDVLLEMVTGTLSGLAPAEDTVKAPVEGVLLTLPKAAGTAVSQDDVLATLYDVNKLEVQFDLDEGDLDTITAGALVTVKLDALPHRDPIQGSVTSIAAISQDGEVTYRAYVALESTQGLRVGLSASVYLR